MRMTLAARTWTWAPPVALMGVIFLFSAQPDLNSGLGLADTIGRKIVHACEYALLAFLWWRALRTTALGPHAIPLAFLLSVAYAATDEFHQTFIHGRHGTPVDVLIDAAGALLALLWVGRRR
jgi:VanZ family protein